jgi:catechol 2,3-dioxygenase
MSARLPDDLRFGATALAVADLERSIDYYRRRLGMDVLERKGRRAALGAGARRLLELEERPGAKREPDAADLFHFALRVPSRRALGRQLARILATDTRLTGASDHAVSEALYLRDPDGHGIEIYRDRPRDTWYRNGRVHMTTTALDLDDLLKEAPARAGEQDGRRRSRSSRARREAPARAGEQDGLDADTVIGHVHLETFDLERSKAFYVDRLGLAVTTERPGATFMSKGGYHHHVALNTWGGKTRPAEDHPGRIGMLWFEIQLPDRSSLAALAEDLGAALASDQPLVDPNGLAIRFVASA